MVAIPKNKPWRSKKYRKWIIDHDCILTGLPGPNYDHHEQLPFEGTMGGKCGDDRLIPLAHYLHVQRHSEGRKFWLFWEGNPEQIIKDLHAEYVAQGGTIKA